MGKKEAGIVCPKKKKKKEIVTQISVVGPAKQIMCMENTDAASPFQSESSD